MNQCCSQRKGNIFISNKIKRLLAKTRSSKFLSVFFGFLGSAGEQQLLLLLVATNDINASIRVLAGWMREISLIFSYHENKPTTKSSCAVNQTEFFFSFFLFISLFEPLNQKCFLNILAQCLLKEKKRKTKNKSGCEMWF